MSHTGRGARRGAGGGALARACSVRDNLSTKTNRTCAWISQTKKPECRMSKKDTTRNMRSGEYLIRTTQNNRKENGDACLDSEDCAERTQSITVILVLKGPETNTPEKTSVSHSRWWVRPIERRGVGHCGFPFVRYNAVSLTQ